MIDIREHGGVFGGGGKSKLNIYTGLTEPAKKEGIWIKTEQSIAEIRNDLELWFANEWNDPALKAYPTSPYGVVLSSILEAKDEKIYLISGTTTLAVFDTLLETFTQLANTPADLRSGEMAYVDNKLYVFKGTGSYAYDIASNTWSTLAANTLNAINAVAVPVASKVYLIGGTGGGSNATDTTRRNHMYDPATNTWTAKAMHPQPANNIMAAVVGTKIYVFGGAENNTNGLSARHYMYDTVTDTWTAKASMPTAVFGSAVAVGTKIYIVSTAATYVYDTQTDTWSQLTGNANAGTSTKQAFANSGIYLFTGTGTYKYNFTSKSYPDGTLIVYRVQNPYGNYFTELVTPSIPLKGVNTRMLAAFDDAYIYTGGTLQKSLPTYYGDGTKWVKFKGA